MKVSVFGLGYVGSVSAASFAADGHEVVGVDVNADKVRAINEGRSPIVEPGLDRLLQDGASSGRLRATTSTADAIDATDLSLICVGTPSRKNGSLDLTYLFAPAEGSGEGPATYPDMRIRIYHDARLVEAQEWASQHGHQALRAMRGQAERELDQRWARNTMLNKWLEYCIDRGHGFRS